MNEVQTEYMRIQKKKSAGGDIFRTRPDRPWVPPSVLYTEYRVSVLGVKRPGRDVNHPPLPSTVVKERIELISTPPLGLHCLF